MPYSVGCVCIRVGNHEPDVGLKREERDMVGELERLGKAALGMRTFKARTNYYVLSGLLSLLFEIKSSVFDL